MGVADSAVGAILEIPPQALTKIEAAQRAIAALGKTSYDAANAVRTHWSNIATQGLDKFIQKIQETQGVLAGMGSKAAKIDVSGIEQPMTQAATTAQTQSLKISDAIKKLAYSDIDFSNISQLDARLKGIGFTYKELEVALKDFNAQRQNKQVDSEEAQKINNKIEALREYIRIKKMSEARQTTATTATDRDYLSEQKKILNDILNIRKQLNTEQIAGARKVHTGGDASVERENINKLLIQLREANTAYRELNRTKSESLSPKGQTDAENNLLRQELALLKEATASREKLNQAITRGTELANQEKLKSAGLGSSADAIYQRTLTGLYQDQIKVLRDIGRVRADVASEGRRASDSEIEKLTLLAEKYRTLQTAIGNMSGKYTKIDQNVQSNFNAERDRQIIENAILKEQAERKYQETLTKTQQLLAGKVDTSATLESLGRFRQEEQKIHDQLVRLQNLIRQLQNERINIQFNMKADLAKQIAPLADRIRELRKLTQQPLGTDKLREYYREMDILKGKIAQAVAAARSQSAANPALVGNQEQIDALTKRYTALAAELSQVGVQSDKVLTSFIRMNESNTAIDAQAQRIQMLGQRLQNLDAIWERLKATNQAFDSTGKLTDKGQRLVELRNEVSQEIQLRKMTASEAKRYEEQKTRDAEAEANKRIAKAKREAQEVKAALAAQKQREISTPAGAINYAKSATTLKQLTDAFRNLKAVMDSTNPKSAEWAQMNAQLGLTKKQIDDIKRKMGEFRNEASSTANVVGQLKGQIAAAFSIGAMVGFAKKVADTRAQFELQRVALGAIIQDTDRANKMFLEVQQMALQSPFTIMGLERATKQIAAFGFETEKIVPTLKMLADMSAGLGVEIDRLVLVMGHLKARNYLEGTMVRQFTNAGFNILGELAKYYSELEGRMISVADVQTRVKKKMVEFGDVEEVLKRVTSAGGMFYDMQKKQSESIYGQIQRITDATDLMLNDIGKSNTGVIKAVLAAIRTLISEWRKFAPLLKTIGGMMLTVFAVKRMRAFAVASTQAVAAIRNMVPAWRSVQTAAEGAAAAGKAAAISWSATGIGLAITGVALLASYLWGCSDAANALNEELDRIGQESRDAFNESIVNFKELTDKITDTTVPLTERNEALTELKRVYSDILPAEKLEMEYLESLKGDYSELTDEIQNYYVQKEYEKKADAVRNSDQAKDVTDKMVSVLKNMNEFGALGLKYSDEQIRDWAGKIADELNTGKLPNTIEDLRKRIEDIFDIDISGIELVDGALESVINKEAKVREAFGNISSSVAMAENAQESFMESFAEEGGSIQTFTANIEAYENAIKTAGAIAKAFGKDSQEYKDAAAEAERYEKALNMINEAREKYQAQQLYDSIKKEYEEIEKSIKAYWEACKELQELERQGIKNGEVWDAQKKSVDALEKSAIELAKKYGLDLNLATIKVARTTYEFKQALLDVTGGIQGLIEHSTKLAALYNMTAAFKNMFKVLGIEVGKFSIDMGRVLNMVTRTPTKVSGASVKRHVDNIKDAFFSDLTKDAVDKFGANMEEIDAIMSDSTKTAKDRAAELRTYAKQERETLEAYNASTNKQNFLKGAGLTEADIKQFEKNAKAAEYIANQLWGEEKKGGKSKRGHGKDPVEKRWENRIDALKRYYDAAEKARKHYTESETKTSQETSFKNQWESLGLNQIEGLSLNDLLNKGFDPKKLKGDYVAALKQILSLIPTKYTEIRNKLQETIASESIEIDFKIKEDAEKKLKEQLDKMFDNYELSKTLLDEGVDINLVYMVGGKPTTLKDISNEIDRLRKEGGGTKDSEERIKILEEAEKKLTETMLKEQKERLKSYEKYLTQMYSDRAKEMIKSYALMSNMERDFSDFRKKLEAEAADPATTEARRKQIEEQIKMIEHQSKEAIRGVKDELNQKMNEFDWNAFKGSDVFTKLYSDLDNLSHAGMDVLISKIEKMRTKLQSMEDVDYRAVREMTQYIEKLKSAKIETSSWKELNTVIKESKKIIGDKSYAQAQKDLFNSQERLNAAKIEVSEIEKSIGLMDKKIAADEKEGKLAGLQQLGYIGARKFLEDKLKKARENVKVAQKELSIANRILNAYENQKAAIKKKISIIQELKADWDKVHGAVVSVAEALGADTDIWGDFSKSMGDAVLQTIELKFQMELLGDEANMALGVIGYVAIALETVANLFVAIFSAHDKGLQKQIDKLEDRVESLDRAFNKLKDSIDNAFQALELKSDSESAIKNLEAQKRAYQEMIALENHKKKKDKDQIKQWNQDIADINDKIQELRESIVKQWGGFGSKDSFASAAQAFAETWLDAYKEAGDGLDALNEKWEEYLDNLLSRQIMLRVVGPKIKSLLETVDRYVSAGSDENEYLTRAELDELKSMKDGLFGSLNEELKNLMEALGIGTSGEFVLSDLQKGIQNITEPQAAAIEAYLNSMRFAVFQHTEQLDALISAVQMQYSSDRENPIVSELKGIRGVLDSIDGRLKSVINPQGRQARVMVG